MSKQNNKYSNEELSNLFVSFYLGDMEARKKIIANNLNLIYLCITSLSTNFKLVDKEDLFSIGEIALIKAVDRFDITKGFKFSTYACTCIKNELYGYLRDKHNYDSLTLSKDYEFTYSNEGIGIDSYLGMIEDVIDIESDYEKKESICNIYVAYSLLNDKYKEAIKLHFGLFGYDNHSIREISEILGINSTQVRWLVEKGVLNLRKILVFMGYDKKSMANSYQYRLKLPKM